MKRITKILILAGALVLAGLSPDNQKKNPQSELKTGDIIAQTSKSNQSRYICASTRSPYSHMGIIVFKDKKPFVLEAASRVQYTSFDEWIKRGVDLRYSVKRLKNNYSENIASVISEAEKFIGKPYDSFFMPSDESLYCSELVEKAFERGADIALGKWETFPHVLGLRRYSPRFREQIRKRWGRFPAELILVTPESIMDSRKLEEVYSNY